jgi:hypothetical protein
MNGAKRLNILNVLNGLSFHVSKAVNGLNVLN